MVNKPPEGFETDDKLDVSIRPNVVSVISDSLLGFGKTNIFL